MKHRDADDELAALRHATAKAVAESRELANWLAYHVRTLGRTLREDAGRRMRGPTDEQAAELRQLTRRAADVVAGELEDLVDAQLKTIDHFSIVFFGRTNIGKSTTIEALAGGDGATISDGRIDFTTEIRGVQWATCRLYDTPGVNGWGGNGTPREALEERARQAVAAADLVVLCFEDSGQHEADFDKVGQWVVQYGKPAVVLLNVKSPVWRKPERVHTVAARRTLSGSVAEHAGHIRAQLGRTELADVPIIAINAQMAFAGEADPEGVHARARQEPDPERRQTLMELAKTVTVQRERYGPPALRQWSNLSTFSWLVATALEHDATGLRMQRLVRQVFGGLDRADAILAVDVQARIEQYAAPDLAGLRQMAKLLGPAMTAPGKKKNPLPKILEKLRTECGVSIDVPPEGAAQQFAGSVISAGLADLRAAAHQRADEAVDAAMRDRVAITAEQFSTRVYDQDAMARASHQILADLVAYVRESLQLTFDDMAADLELNLGKGLKVNGEAGELMRWSSIAVRLSPVATAAAVFFFASNPFGWAALAVTGAVGIAAKLLGGRMKEKSSSAHVAAETGARAQARQDVDATFDGIAEALRERFAEIGAEVVRGPVRDTADRALALCTVAVRTRSQRDQIARLRGGLTDRLGGLAPGNSPAAPQILLTAMQLCETEAGLGGPAVWLGESWIDDRQGLAEGEAAAPPAARRPQRSMLGRLRRRVARAVDRRSAMPKPGSGIAWLDELEQDLGGAEEFAAELAELRALSTATRPRIAVCGDYDTGKSSFIRRILVDEGEPVPSSLVIRADPTTAVAAEYELPDVVLVDTPGFQSGDREHSRLAAAAVADAAGVIYLFNNGLINGVSDNLAVVLTGDPDSGVPAKAGCALFVVNRADRLVADPVEDLDGFRRRTGRKRAELRAALVAHGAAVPAEHIFAVASDPLQTAGFRTELGPEHFDEYRDWDGFRELMEAIDDLRAGLADNGADISVLNGGLARLARWRSGLAAALSDGERRHQELLGLASEVTRLMDAGRAIGKDLRAQLTNQLTDYAVALLNEAVAEPDQTMRAQIAAKLNDLGADPQFTGKIAEWSRRAGTAVESWRIEAHKVLDLRSRRKAFTAAFTAGVETDVFSRYRLRNRRAVVTELSSLIGRLASTRAHAVMAGGVAKAVRMSRFGAILQVATAAWDIGEIVVETRQEKADQAGQVRLRQAVRDEAERIAEHCFDNDPAIVELGDLVRECEQRHAEWLEAASAEKRGANAAIDRIERCERHIANAQKRLSQGGTA